MVKGHQEEVRHLSKEGIPFEPQRSPFYSHIVYIYRYHKAKFELLILLIVKIY